MLYPDRRSMNPVGPAVETLANILRLVGVSCASGHHIHTERHRGSVKGWSRRGKQPATSKSQHRVLFIGDGGNVHIQPQPLRLGLQARGGLQTRHHPLSTSRGVLQTRHQPRANLGVDYRRDTSSVSRCCRCARCRLFVVSRRHGSARVRALTTN